VSEPRFFCENCGAEVPRDEEKCPECGKRFASVRCPACGFIGEVANFRAGCPKCGYSLTGTPPSNANAMAKAKTRRRKKTRKDKAKTASLPLWIYILAGAGFTAIFAALLFMIFE
jgi:uncharacterized membrane protein YvbJ